MGLEFLLRPVQAGMCKYESLKDKSIKLLDLARMNDYLNVRAENQERMEKYLEAKRQ